MDSREALLHELQQAYEVAYGRESFGSLAIDVYRIADPDTHLDDDRILAASYEELAWHPYWVHAGAAAAGVALQLSRWPLSGRRVLDLGCGLGVTSAVAAAAGARVTACDHAPPALQFTRLNTFAFEPLVDVRRFDWKHDRLTDDYDVIVGSDILYHRDDLPYLDRIFRENLRDGGIVLLGDPNRPLTRELHQRLEALGWNLRRRVLPTPYGEARLVLLWGEARDDAWDSEEA